MTKTFQPSPYQAKIFDFISNGRGSALVIAVAGSGKTTTVMKCLPLIPETKSVQLFAFNAAIAKELKERLAEMSRDLGRPFQKVRASTFHAIGFGAVKKFLGRDDIEPDDKKLVKIARAKMTEEDHEMYGAFVVALVKLARGEGIGAIVPDIEERWLNLIAHHDLYLEHQDAVEARAVEIARKLLVKSNEAGKLGNIDYDDMLYLPLLWRLRLWQNDFVFIDESQDTNPVRRAIAKLALRPGGRLVAVGDPCQSIYGFTGASTDAMDLIKHEFACAELPLTVSYRCATNIVAEAQPLVPHLEAAPGAPAGIVEHVSMRQALVALTASDAILCRNTKPLVETAFALIAAGRGCAIAGKDIGAGLVSLVKNMKAQGIDRLQAKLEDYRSREVAKFTAKGEEQKAENVSDRVACVYTVIDHLHENERTVPALIAKIEGLFNDHAGALTLSTVHKAKGREWDRVAIIAPELMPSKWARQEWQAQQERNIQYVAYTRAKSHLMFVDGVDTEEGEPS